MISYSDAQNEIAKNGGYSHIETAPLEAKNKYAADELAQSLHLNAKFLYEQATKKGYDLTQDLREFDSLEEKPAFFGVDLVNKLFDMKEKGNG